MPFHQIFFIALQFVNNRLNLHGNHFLREARIALHISNQNKHFIRNHKNFFNFAEKIVSDLQMKLLRNLLKSQFYILGKMKASSSLNSKDCCLIIYLKYFWISLNLREKLQQRVNNTQVQEKSSSCIRTSYRMSPTKKQYLKKELDDLLISCIIEEWDSTYISTILLESNPNENID